MPEKFSRPWQAKLNINPATCVFETRPQQVIRTIEQPNDDGWIVLQSSQAPEPYHRLIIPKTCRTWSEGRTRTLGGAKKMAEAFMIARRTLIEDRMFDCAQFSVQIGPLAAQNQAHLHYHLYAEEETPLECIAENMRAAGVNTLTDHVIMEDNYLKVIAGGLRTGQCLFLPHSEGTAPRLDEEFAKTVSAVVDLYAQKFMSVEDQLPDFGFEFSIRNGMVSFGTLIPILNQIGTKEYMALFTPHTRTWNLLWSHAETARYLRGK